jgi:F-type H+-transporting ATPase subunit epsilon
MRLRVLLPEQILLDTDVQKVTAEAENGSFGLLPRHADFVTALVPGILTFTPADGREEFLAVDEGILVKCGADVRVSTRNAVLGQELGVLKRSGRRTLQKSGRVREEIARCVVQNGSGSRPPLHGAWKKLTTPNPDHKDSRWEEQVGEKETRKLRARRRKRTQYLVRVWDVRRGRLVGDGANAFGIIRGNLARQQGPRPLLMDAHALSGRADARLLQRLALAVL